MELVELGSLLTITKGKKPAIFSKEKLIGYMPYVDIQAFETGKIDSYTNGEKCLPCEDGDILIVCDGSRSGLVGRAIRGYVGSTLAKISANELDDLYLFYFVQSKYTLLNTNKKGTGTPHLNQELLKQQRLLVPPLFEQRCIVSRIEELLSSLDEGVKTLLKIKEQLKIYRQAVLKDAFEGKFTEKWRNNNAISISSWKEKRIFDLCEVVRGGSPRPAKDPRFYGGNIPFMKVADITKNKTPFISSTEFSITELGLKKTRKVGPNTLLLTNSGATLGVPTICTFETTFNDGIAAFLGLDPRSLLFFYYFWTFKTSDLRAINMGAAQPNLNTEIIGNVKISLPTIPEQQEIVSEIERRLSICTSINQTVETTLQQAEAIRQSILKQAFVGRL